MSSSTPPSSEPGPDGVRRAVVVASLGRGGAERVVSRLSRIWAERGETVAVFTWEAPGAAPAWPLHDAVSIHRLDQAGSSGGSATRGLLNNLRRARALRTQLRNFDPDVVISFVDTTNITTALAGLYAPWPTVVAERSDPELAPLPARWRRARRMLYPRCAALVCQTRRAMDHFDDLALERRWIIPNPVPEPPFAPRPMAEREALAVAVGRLGPEKGFDLLIPAFAEAAPPHWRLEIAGEGPERGALQDLIDAGGLSERVRLIGFVDDVYPLLDRAQVFVLSSRREGFPNALLEAMSMGCAVLSFDCPSGPSDIVRHELDGLLAPPENPAALNRMLARLCEDPELRRVLGAMARDVTRRLSEETVTDLWDRLIRGCAAKR